MASLGRRLLCILWCGSLVIGPVVAQPAGGPAIDETKLPEWVKRQARSPIQVIIESTAVRARGDAPKEPAVAARAPKPAPPRKAAGAAPTVTASAPVVAATPAVPAESAESAKSVKAVAATSPAAPPDETAAPPARPALQLLVRVEPELPAEAVADGLAAAEVIVTFVVNTDGSVANASIDASSDVRLNQSILRAVGEWRYAPIASARPHAVKFTFAMP